MQRLIESIQQRSRSSLGPHWSTRINVGLALLLVLPLALAGFLFLFKLFLGLLFSGPVSGGLAVRPSPSPTLGIPNGVELFTILLIISGVVLVVAAALMAAKSRRAMLVCGALALALLAIGLWLLLSGAFSRDVSYQQHLVNLDAIDALWLVLLGGFFLSIVVVAVIRPRYLAFSLLVWALVWLFAGLPDLSGLSGLNLFRPVSELQSEVTFPHQASADDSARRVSESTPPQLETATADASSGQANGKESCCDEGESPGGPITQMFRDGADDLQKATNDVVGSFQNLLTSEPFLTSLKEGSPDEREAAANLLGEMGDQRAVGPLIDALDDESPQVRRSAAEALGKLGDSTAVDPLIDALNDDSPEVREAAANALGELRDPQASEALVDALGDSNEQVGQAALQSLEDLSANTDVGLETTALESGSTLVSQEGTTVGLVGGATTAQASDLPHLPVFEVWGAAHTRYLRTTVGDIYEDGFWKSYDPVRLDYRSSESIPGTVQSALAAPGSAFAQVSPNQVEPGLLAYPTSSPAQSSSDLIAVSAGANSKEIPRGVVPTSRQLESVNLPGTYQPFSGTFSLAEATPGYSWTSSVLAFSPEQLNAATITDNPTYLQLPADLPARVRGLAEQITASATTPYQKAKAIEDYLRTHYQYGFADPSSGTDYPPPGQDPVDWFLFDHQTGTCGNFSSAFVILARSVGIPARVVSGWAMSATPDFQTVYTDQAHQWAEVGFSDLGWVTFEPTAAGAPSRTGAPGDASTTSTPQPDEDHVSDSGSAPETGGDTQSQDGTESQGDTSGSGDEGAGSGDTSTGGNESATESPGVPAPDGQSTPPDDPPSLDSSVPEIQATTTEITQLPTQVRKGYPFTVGGTVTSAQGTVVNSMPVEIFLNETKEHGGLLIGTGVVVNGRFSVDAVLPSDVNVGGYQVLAHAVETSRFTESWSDPQISVYSGTHIGLSGPSEISIDSDAVFNGSLLEETGGAVSAHEVEVWLDKSLFTRTETDARGAFTFTTVFQDPGVHSVEARFGDDASFLGNTAELEVTATVPTQLVLNAPEQVPAGKDLVVEGQLLTLRGSASGGLAHKNLTVVVDDAFHSSVNTDEQGDFSATLTPNDIGPHSITVSYDEDGSFNSASSEALLVSVVKPSSTWLMWVLLLLVAVAGVATGFVLQVPLLAGRLPTLASPLGTTKPGASGQASTGLRPGSPGVIGGETLVATRLEVSPVPPSPDLPPVWGVGEAIAIESRLFAEDGTGVPKAFLNISVDGEELSHQLATDNQGYCTISWAGRVPGTHQVSVQFPGDRRHLPCSGQEDIRVVDFREEVVRLYNSFLEWARQEWPDISPQTTPREVELTIVKSGLAVPQKALEEIIRRFEEADYSERSVSRREYEAMYRAWRDVTGDE